MALLTNIKADTGYNVPPGSVFPFSGVVAPAGWLLCNGATVSRTTYANLFNLLSPSQTCNTNSSTTVTVQDSSVMSVGMSIFGVGIPLTATIASITNATTIVISLAATATATGVSLRFGGFGYGDWNGTTGTTFHLPDFRGRFVRGWSNTSSNDPDRTSRTSLNTGGNTKDTIGSLQAEAFASHNHTLTNGGYSVPGGLTNPAFDYSNFSGSPPGDRGVNYGYTTAGTNFYSSHTHNNTLDASGGSETRPKNVNINYIIKT